MIRKTLLATALTALISLPALAEGKYNLAITNSFGGVVHDSNGGCVTTSFTTRHDTCHTCKTVMMMDERMLYFAFDNYSLTGESKTKLDTMAKVFKDHNIKTVNIVGYTDRIGTDAYNDSLSNKRANAVKKYLSSKVKMSMPVEVKGLGKTNQLQSCEGVSERNALISCLAPNRRVELQVNYADDVVVNQ